jgi:hypothetical protein
MVCCPAEDGKWEPAPRRRIRRCAKRDVYHVGKWQEPVGREMTLPGLLVGALVDETATRAFELLYLLGGSWRAHSRQLHLHDAQTHDQLATRDGLGPPNLAQGAS